MFDAEKLRSPKKTDCRSLNTHSPLPCTVHSVFADSVLLPSVQQPSVPLLVAASSAWSPLSLDKNPFLSITLWLPLCLLPAPQEFPISTPAPGCVPSLHHGIPASPRPPQVFTLPQGQEPGCGKQQPFPCSPGGDILPKQNVQHDTVQKSDAPIPLPCPSLQLEFHWKAEIPLASL